MRFVCIGYYDPARIEAAGPEAVRAMMAKCPPHMEALRSTGKLSLVAGTDDPALYLRRVGGKIETGKTPYVGTGAKIGCVYLVEAANIEEAAHIAQLHPTTQLDEAEAMHWWTEVRPVHYFEKDGKSVS